MSLFVPTWRTEKRGETSLLSSPDNPEKSAHEEAKPFPPLSGDEGKGIYPSISPAHPCVDCHAETEPEDLFCPECWEKRLARMPQDVGERRRRLDRVRREKRAELLATSPHTGLTATSPASAIPPEGAA
jgi:hypothetical protein